MYVRVHKKILDIECMKISDFKINHNGHYYYKKMYKSAYISSTRETHDMTCDLYAHMTNYSDNTGCPKGIWDTLQDLNKIY